MERCILGFSQDDAKDWVALLDCGHRRHVRNRPLSRTAPGSRPATAGPRASAPCSSAGSATRRSRPEASLPAWRIWSVRSAEQSSTVAPTALGAVRRRSRARGSCGLRARLDSAIGPRPCRPVRNIVIRCHRTTIGEDRSANGNQVRCTRNSGARAIADSPIRRTARPASPTDRSIRSYDPTALQRTWAAAVHEMPATPRHDVRRRRDHRLLGPPGPVPPFRQRLLGPLLFCLPRMFRPRCTGCPRRRRRRTGRPRPSRPLPAPFGGSTTSRPTPRRWCPRAISPHRPPCRSSATGTTPRPIPGHPRKGWECSSGTTTSRPNPRPR